LEKIGGTILKVRTDGRGTTLNVDLVGMDGHITVCTELWRLTDPLFLLTGRDKYELATSEIFHNLWHENPGISTQCWDHMVLRATSCQLINRSYASSSTITHDQWHCLELPTVTAFSVCKTAKPYFLHHAPQWCWSV